MKGGYFNWKRIISEVLLTEGAKRVKIPPLRVKLSGKVNPYPIISLLVFNRDKKNDQTFYFYSFCSISK
tara:strand:- start:1172 stop:1378 length:207 start_codon:yes stop_codon:yes gene_type:complete